MTGSEPRELRKSAGLTVTKLAKLMDMTYEHVSKMEQGRRPIRRVVEFAARYVVEGLNDG